jgi:hypothetical protein
MIPVTRGYFETRANLCPGVGSDPRAVLKFPPDADAESRLWAIDPQWNAMLRTTCIVREIAGDWPSFTGPGS